MITINSYMSKPMSCRYVLVNALLGVCMAASAVDNQAGTDTIPMPTKECFLGALANDADVNRLVLTVKTNYGFIGKLGKEKSEKARAALLRIAYGEIGDHYVINAASWFRMSLEDKCLARPLLVADNPEVCDCGLGATKGCHVDGQLFALLKRCLCLDSALTRHNAAWVLAASTDDGLSKAKAELILESMKTTLATKDSKRKITFGTEMAYQNIWPIGEYSLSEQAKLLGKLPGIASETLRLAAPNEDGPVRNYMTLARAYAGDNGVKNDVKRLLKESQSERLRLCAVEAFAALANKDDIPFLQTIAETDPSHREAVAGHYQESDARVVDGETVVFPVRMAAGEVVKSLRQLSSIGELHP